MTEPPFEVLRPEANGPFVVICDHASNFVPPELNNLGLSMEDLSRHIAWDIGVAAIAGILSERFNSPAVFCGTSRLVIDCNRQLDASDLIPEMSDGTGIPANRNLSKQDRQSRIARFFLPYHDAIEEIIERRPSNILLSIHSMTDRMQGVFRPWPISISSFEDRSLVEPLLGALRASKTFAVGDNEPYDLDPKVDYSTPYHAIRRGLPHLQIEFRQDEVGTEQGQRLWAGKFGDALEKAGILVPGPR